MLNTNYTTIQNVRRNYKKVAEDVAEAKTPTVVISNNQPQFAIISLEMLGDLEKAMNQKSGKGLVDLAEWAEKEHISGPRDLSQNHDKYAWEG